MKWPVYILNGLEYFSRLFAKSNARLTTRWWIRFAWKLALARPTCWLETRLRPVSCLLGQARTAGGKTKPAQWSESVIRPPAAPPRRKKNLKDAIHLSVHSSGSQFLENYINIFVYLQIFVHISVNLFSKIIICLFLNIYLYLWFVTKKYFVVRNFRGTCSSAGMLKGCLIREKLGTPALNNEWNNRRRTLKCFIHVNARAKFKQKIPCTVWTITAENATC